MADYYVYKIIEDFYALVLAWQKYFLVYLHFCVKVQGSENGCLCLIVILFMIRYLI